MGHWPRNINERYTGLGTSMKDNSVDSPKNSHLLIIPLSQVHYILS